LPKAFKNRGHFPSNAAAIKLIFLVLRDITKKWENPLITWKLAVTQLGERFFAIQI